MKKSHYLIAVAAATMLACQSYAQISLPFVEDFEATSPSVNMWDLTNPEPIVVVDNSESGYGVGSQALMYNFYAPLGYTQFNAKTPLINNPEHSGLKVSFDFAACVRYTVPVFLQDGFAVDFIYLYGSKDSGSSWTLLDTFRIDTAGILNTYGCYGDPFVCGASPNMLFIPNDTQWTTISDIKLPRGTNMVNFMGVRTNDWESNFAYMDNVKIDTCYTPKPLADSIQFDSAYATIADLQVNGSSLAWYSDPEGMDSLTDATPLTDSTYYFVTQTVNGCESAPLAVLFEDTTTTTPTGTADLGIFKNVSVYPNPAKENLIIDADIAIQSISITDIAGKTIMHIPHAQKAVDVSYLQPGIYYVTLRAKDAAKTFKITKL